MLYHVMYFFLWSGDPPNIHLFSRGQRQMCIRYSYHNTCVVSCMYVYVCVCETREVAASHCSQAQHQLCLAGTSDSCHSVFSSCIKQHICHSDRAQYSCWCIFGSVSCTSVVVESQLGQDELMIHLHQLSGDVCQCEQHKQLLLRGDEASTYMGMMGILMQCCFRMNRGSCTIVWHHWCWGAQVACRPVGV